MADAEEEQVSGRTKDLSINCSPCDTKGKETPATKYCFMCETSFCQECTDHHNEFLSKHRVTEIESANVGVNIALHTEPCPEHGGAITLYCKDDDSICCDECFFREHLKCKEVVYLPSSAQDVIKNIDVAGIKSKMSKTIEQLGSIKIKQQATVASLKADRETCLKKIDDQHKELIDLLEKIVQSSKDQVEQTFERFSADLQRHQQKVEKCLNDLESIEKRLERNQGNDFRLFVELKKYQTQLEVTEEVSTSSLENLKVRGFSVVLDDQVHILLSELESLVTVMNKAPVQVKKKYQIDVQEMTENTTCNIRGSCVLHDGSILLADWNNTMLKCIDHHSLKVTDQCTMKARPSDVCVINNREVAVTLTNNTLVIVSVRPRLTPTRTINIDHSCEGIAYCQGELFVTDESSALYIYTMEGSLMRKVATDQSGQNIFSRARHIMINATSDKVYVADCDNGLIILDREGQVQDKRVIDKIHGTRGLCLDGMGGLYVCGNISHNVVHVGADGQILTELLTTSDGLANPLSVCNDIHNKRLIVTQFGSNSIHVCELE